MIRKKEKPIYRDAFDGKGEVTFVSPDEMWFAWWCEELKQKGLLREWAYQATTWEISAACKLIWQEQGAKKMLDKSACLLRPHTYTADFTLDWYCDSSIERYVSHVIKVGSAECRFVGDAKNAIVLCSTYGPSDADGKITTWRGFVDVKGLAAKGQRYSSSSKDATFSITRGVVWDKYGDYVNRIVPHSNDKRFPKCLFRDTFVPRRFLFTDHTARMRSIQYPVRSIEEWLKSAEA